MPKEMMPSFRQCSISMNNSQSWMNQQCPVILLTTPMQEETIKRQEQIERDPKGPWPVSNENLTSREVARKPAQPDPVQLLLKQLVWQDPTVRKLKVQVVVEVTVQQVAVQVLVQVSLMIALDPGQTH